MSGAPWAGHLPPPTPPSSQVRHAQRLLGIQAFPQDHVNL